MLLEVCVDTIEGAAAAVRGGAGRIELCSALSEGGLTPSLGLMKAASTLAVPCYAMIRPRSGLFEFNAADESIMMSDIAAARSCRLAGVVLGVQTADGQLNTAMLKRLIKHAEGMGLTLHRVIDVLSNPLAGLQTAAELGFDRVLTSGAEPFAPAGQEMIAAMVLHAQGRLSVMPGCGITAENVSELVAATGVCEVHAACSLPVGGDLAFSDFDPAGGRMMTSENEVRRMVEVLALL